MKIRSVLLLTLCLAVCSRSLSTENPVAGSSAEAGYDKALQAELLAIFDEDQQGRLQIEMVAKDHGYKSPEIQTLWISVAAKDAVNLAKVKSILDTRGWVGADVVGPKANSTLFLVIQHADTATQQKYLPLMRAAVQAKKAQARDLALLEDRVALAEGRRQTYGSQLATDPTDDHLYVSPLEDPAHVDERRATVGLGTMADYLKHWNLTWDVEAYKRQLPALEALASSIRK